MDTMPRRKLLCTLAALLLGAASSARAQEASAANDWGKKLPSPPAQAHVELKGKLVAIDYNTPSMRGRKIFGGLVPYGKVWRTGANPATTLKTEINLKIGGLAVPAGTYTLYSLPSETAWKLIVNKQTGQWGTIYNQDQDLGRVEMKHHTLDSPQEVMSLSFDDIKKDSAEFHIRWDTTDESVKISTP